MIIAAIVAIIFIIFIRTSILNDSDTIIEHIGYTFLSLVLGAVVLFIGLLIACGIGMAVSSTYTMTSSTPIVALKDNKATQGRFFLGSGTVDEDLQYYYAENSSRGYKVKTVDADECYILFDDDNPRIERYDASAFNKKRHYIYAMPCGRYYNLYIPHGSITTEFKVDLE